MKITLPVLVAGAVGLTGAVSLAIARSADEHTIVSPKEMKWTAAPPSLPPGAKAAVLYGDPAKEGQFAMRLKVPKATTGPWSLTYVNAADDPRKK